MFNKTPLIIGIWMKENPRELTHTGV